MRRLILFLHRSVFQSVKINCGKICPKTKFRNLISTRLDLFTIIYHIYFLIHRLGATPPRPCLSTSTSCSCMTPSGKMLSPCLPPHAPLMAVETVIIPETWFTSPLCQVICFSLLYAFISPFQTGDFLHQSSPILGFSKYH